MSDARASLFADGISDNCPFCGSDLPGREGTALMLHQAHNVLERLALVDRDSEEFDELLDEAARFVGAR